MKSTFSKIIIVIILLFVAVIAAISIATKNSNVDSTLKAVNQTVAVTKKKHNGKYELIVKKDQTSQYSFPRLDSLKKETFKKGTKLSSTKLVQDEQTNFYKINDNTYVLSSDVDVK
ncbi:hypothetical protein FD688_05275 [Apilactobacillus kunkeei]|uniref:hypothetical protein n=1 Tax=Apilactobacillus kunkeei TaxID=148814 RepID=UPI00110D2296|nr:hypothetical protein [Apilactobacillus kunkeei]TMT00112.1 hypothetical protein FD688_05275 [Apilactobacillus kunkeei]